MLEKWYRVRRGRLSCIFIYGKTLVYFLTAAPESGQERQEEEEEEGKKGEERRQREKKGEEAQEKEFKFKLGRGR